MFFGKENTNDCDLGLQAFLLLAKSLGLAVKMEKTFTPSTSLEMHGIQFDSVAMTMSLPKDKVEKAVKLLDEIFRKKKVQLKKIQEIHGFLNFAGRAIPPGRTFLRRIANLMIKQSVANHFIKINKEASKDFQAWKFFLEHFNSTPILPPIK
ncbi:MAG: hypothetical protein GY705_18350 [Bacteroidetes bacterium]|nr:hypothetical protein [Bacteroidota bacterium]